MPSEKLITFSFFLHYPSSIYVETWIFFKPQYESTGLTRCEVRANNSHFNCDFLQEVVFFPL